MGNSLRRALYGAATTAALIAAPLGTATAFAVDGGGGTIAGAAAPHVEINEAYLSGGSAGAAYKNKFVELYNPTDTPVSVANWSLQYRPATGTGAPAAVTLAGSIAAHGYYLIKSGSNGANGADLPAADVDGSKANFSGSAGTIVLSSQPTALTLGTGSITGNAAVVDLLGYGTSNTFETAAATAPAGNTDVKSLNRTNFADSDNNQADFSVSASITPQGTGGTTVPPVDPGPGTTQTIEEIQGAGATSPFAGASVTTRGKVTAVYPTGGFDGYYIQTPGTGGDVDLTTHATSDAVFVYSKDTVGTVKPGDYVEVTGTVSEFGGASDTNKLTELSVAAAGFKQLTEAAPEVKPAVVALPTTDAQRESLEGMLFTPQGHFTVTDNYSLNQYGEMGLATGDTALVQPTDVAAYGSADYNAVVAENAARAIKLDDGASTNFLKDATTKAMPLPYVTPTTPVNVGAAATFTTNVIFDNRNNAYKFQPLTALTPDVAATVQPATFTTTRADHPADVGGNLKIASFNVQNYFPTTGDQSATCKFYTDRDGNPITVSSGCDQRGAANAENLKRQQDKIVAGIINSGADILSLEEIENSVKFGKDRDNALATLVAALNAAAPNTWDYVHSPATVPAQEDVIRTAFVYKKAVAEPVGTSTILDDASFTGIARQPLAQAFKPVGAADSTKFLAIVNHFKSKGSAATPDDTDKGQGNSNLARVAQANALVKFADSQQTAAGTDKVFLIGDFNAYSHEDPINVLTGAGYVDQDPKTGKHSYSYGGTVGSLDHILASPAANAVVSGADIWNINSTESVAFNYSRYNYNVTNFYAPNQFSASDHDPVVVGLNLSAPQFADLNLLDINDFHGRIDSNTVNFAGTVEQLKAAAPAGSTAFLSAGDNVGASLFASSVAKDQPTIDVLNALGLQASSVGNHEFDQSFADLTDRIINKANPNAKWDYLGANVYLKGTQTPALDEYKVITLNGVRVAVIGAVTQETPSLVTPGGISNLDFGDPVDAVNRVAAKITADKSADVIVAEYHEGAGAGTPDGATLDQEVAAGGAFAKIVTQTSPAVNAIFTGHTHKQYVWDGAIPGVAADAAVKTRPIVQTGSYGENIGQIQLHVDTKDMSVASYKAGNVARTTADPATLVATYPAVAKVKEITDNAIAAAAVVGNQAIGKVTADITTAYTTDPVTGTKSRDDRSSESTLGNLVADSLAATLKDSNLGGAEIGIVNPGGLRSDLMYGADGTVTYAQANAVLPFVNNLWTTSLTGDQFKTLLEQQWQTNADGSIPSRPYLQLGVSKNVSYTYDPSKPAGQHITSVTVNGAPLDAAKSYRIGTFSFLITGGDNFRIFTQGTNAKDSGLVDRDGWIKYLQSNSPVSPDFARRSVAVSNAPSAVKANDALNISVSKLDLTSLGSPANTTVSATFLDSAGKSTALGNFAVANGAATITGKVPAAAAGAGSIVFTSTPSNTVATLPVTVEKAANVCTPPVPPKSVWDIFGWIKYAAAWLAYLGCRIHG